MYIEDVLNNLHFTMLYLNECVQSASAAEENENNLFFLINANINHPTSNPATRNNAKQTYNIISFRISIHCLYYAYTSKRGYVVKVKTAEISKLRPTLNVIPMLGTIRK